MSEIACRRWLRYGSAVLGSTAVLAQVANFFFGWLPHPLDWTAMGFHLTLGLFWLGTGVLYMLERNFMVAVATVVGIDVVAMLHFWAGIPLVPAQLIGIFTAAAFSIWVAMWLLGRRAAKDSGRVHRQMPVRTLYLTAPYIVYGCLYYLFLFADRLMAWTAQTESASLPLMFRGDYELPLDVALFAFVIQVGWVHSSMKRFYEQLKSSQLACEIDRVDKFNREMQHFYIRRIVLFLPLALVVSAAVWAISWRGGFLHGDLATRVGLFALAGYPFLVIGLWNVSLLFALSLPKSVLPAIALGTLGNAAAGYVLSRVISYDWAVAGFTVGALAFGLISSATVYRRFHELDYYYFASAA